MKANRSSSKTGHFLIELIIGIAFFAYVTGNVCVPIFVESRLVSQQSRNLNRAVAVAQTAAEGFKSGEDAAGLAALLGGSADNDSVTLYYDKLWQACGAAVDGGHYLTLNIASGDMSTAEIDVKAVKDDSAVYSVLVSRYEHSGG